MNKIKEFDFNGDVYLPMTNTVPTITQYDTSIVLNFFLTSKRAALDLTNSIVKARLITPETNSIVEQEIDDVSAKDGVCRVLINDFSTSEVGTVQGLLDVFDPVGHKYSILKFSFIVNSYLGELDADIEHDSNYPILNQLIETVSILNQEIIEAESERKTSETYRENNEIERISAEEDRERDFGAKQREWESRFVAIETEPTIHIGTNQPSRATTMIWFDPSDNEAEAEFAELIVSILNRLDALENNGLEAIEYGV